MKFGVLGTGLVGRTLAAKLVELKHEVIIGTRDVAATLSQTEPNARGLPPLQTWREQNPEVQIETFAQAAARSEILVNTTAGNASLEVLQGIGAELLSGKILVDTSNPLDFSRGIPPTLSVVNTDSLGEQIQRVFPETKVVKALNTVVVELMVNPVALAGGDHDLFICGNDAEAKRQVTELLTGGFGWTHVTDLGDISAARGMEMLLPLFFRLWSTFRTRQLNLKVVAE